MTDNEQFNKILETEYNKVGYNNSRDSLYERVRQTRRH